MRFGRIILAILAPLVGISSLTHESIPGGDKPPAGAAADLHEVLPFFAAVSVHAAQLASAHLQHAVVFPAPAPPHTLQQDLSTWIVLDPQTPVSFRVRFPNLLRC